MTHHFHICAPADLPALMTLIEEYYTYDGHDFDAAKLRAALLDFLVDHRWGFAWLIYVDDQLAGYMSLMYGYSLEHGGRDAFIDELYLREAFRGKGLGKAAILHMIATCRRERIKTLHLEVEQGNDRARLVYERLGFVPDDSLMMHYEID